MKSIGFVICFIGTRGGAPTCVRGFVFCVVGLRASLLSFGLFSPWKIYSSSTHGASTK